MFLFSLFQNYLKMSLSQQSNQNPSDNSLQNIAELALSSAQKSGAVNSSVQPSVIDGPMQESPIKVQSVNSLPSNLWNLENQPDNLSRQNNLNPLDRQTSLLERQLTPGVLPERQPTPLTQRTTMELNQLPMMTSQFPLSSTGMRFPQMSLERSSLMESPPMSPLDRQMSQQMGSLSRQMSPLDRQMSQQQMSPLDRQMSQQQMSPLDRQSNQSSSSSLDRQMSPLDRQMSPLDRQMSPLDRQMSPLDRQMSPLDRQMSPLDRQMSPLDRQSNQSSSSSLDRQMSPLDRQSNQSSSSSLDRQMSPLDRQMSPLDRQMSPLDRQSNQSSSSSLDRSSNEPLMDSLNRQLSPQSMSQRQSMSPLERQMNSLNRQMTQQPMSLQNGNSLDRQMSLQNGNSLDREMTPQQQSQSRQISPLQQSSNRQMSPQTSFEGQMNSLDMQMRASQQSPNRQMIKQSQTSQPPMSPIERQISQELLGQQQMSLFDRQMSSDMNSRSMRSLERQMTPNSQLAGSLSSLPAPFSNWSQESLVPLNTQTNGSLNQPSPLRSVDIIRSPLSNQISVNEIQTPFNSAVVSPDQGTRTSFPRPVESDDLRRTMIMFNSSLPTPLGSRVIEPPTINVSRQTPASQPREIDSIARSLFLPPPVGSYADAISGNYDNELLKNGYVRLDTVTIDTEGGERAIYVKAYNLNGDICYIDITKPSGITVQLSNRTRVKAVQGSSISPSVISGTQECAGNGVCGLAFDCEGGFCVLNKGDDGKSYPRTYIVVEATRKKVTPYGSPVAYPIITIDEIVANNEDAITRVRKATQNIQNRAMVESVLTMNSLYDEINKLNGSVKPTSGTRDSNLQVAAVGPLNSMYAKLQSHRRNEQDMFLTVLSNLRGKQTNGTADATDLENIRKVTLHLYGLNLECGRLLNMINAFSRMKEKIRRLKVKTEDTYWSMFLESTTNIFQTTNATNPDGSLLYDTRSSKSWGLPEEVDKLSFEEIMQGALDNLSQTEEVLQLKRVVSGYSTPGGSSLTLSPSVYGK